MINATVTLSPDAVRRLRELSTASHDDDDTPLRAEVRELLAPLAAAEAAGNHEYVFDITLRAKAVVAADSVTAANTELMEFMSVGVDLTHDKVTLVEMSYVPDGTAVLLAVDTQEFAVQ